ncbi:BLUF domain-containing protein [Mesorhizobium japonicum]|uniref:BLUF domain-containing protein n=1 Tax=Mesorhizobium japonicum TaxID=2066070 RepID=UPI003B59EAC6
MLGDPLFSVVYTSVATEPFDDDQLRALLEQSRTFNTEAGVTGMLLYRSGRFIQFLEGPERVVRGLVQRISADPRHGRVRVLLEDHVDRRQFADWSMGYQPSSGDTSRMPVGYRRSFDDLDEHVDHGLMVQAAWELTMWFRQRPDSEEPARERSL